jgi:hypothetical protein
MMQPDRVTTPTGAQIGAGHALFERVLSRDWHATTRILLVALVLAIVCWYLGANVWHSILFGGVLDTVGVICSAAGGTPDLGSTAWPTREPSTREGARNDVAELSWSLRGKYGRVGETATLRIQRLAEQRIALHQLRLHDAADRDQIEYLIGRRAYAVLAGRRRRPLTLRSLLNCLDMLNVLDKRGQQEPSRAGDSTAVSASHRPRRAHER